MSIWQIDRYIHTYTYIDIVCNINKTHDAIKIIHFIDKHTMHNKSCCLFFFFFFYTICTVCTKSTFCTRIKLHSDLQCCILGLLLQNDNVWNLMIPSIITHLDKIECPHCVQHVLHCCCLFRLSAAIRVKLSADIRVCQTFAVIIQLMLWL